MKSLLFLFFSLPLFCTAQYCVPTQETAAVAPVIDRVAIGTIDNDGSGFGLTDFGYSDYTDLTTIITAGEPQSIVIETGDFFPHNIGVWIDYDRNGNFSEDEVIDIFEIGGSSPLSKEIEFEVPASATNGRTRLRVRGFLEPFGPWSLSMHPCMPSEFDGETEDYSIDIVGGISGSVAITEWLGLDSKVDLGEEAISIEIKNIGSVPATDVTAIFKVDNSVVFSENIPGTLQPDNSINYTFLENYDFSGISCKDISASIEWQGDENLDDNVIEKSICKLTQINGEKVWYLHSNINGGLEPLGGDPFFSTTNVVTMNTVFGENNWQQGYFETANIDEVFSDSTCVIFLDASFDHTPPFETLLANNKSTIENWVAAGGKLFINCAKEFGEFFYTNVGFDNTFISFYSVGHARLEASHPISDGPFQPLANNYTGFYYSNAVISGDNLSTVVFDTGDEWNYNAPILHLPILADKPWGAGKVLFGGLTPSQLVEPMAESMNLRANALDYLHECEIVSSIIPSSVLSDTKIYPNPVSEKLFIDGIESYNDFKSVRIYTPSGKLAMETALGQTDNIDVSVLPAGLYFIELKMKNLVKVSKFVKK